MKTADAGGRDKGAANSLRLLVEAQRLAQVGSWFWDLASDRVSGSDEFFRLYGIDDDEAATLTPAQGILHVHPDDRHLVLDVWQRALRGDIGDHGEVETEYRVVWRDGTERRLRGNIKLELGADGGVRGMLGIVQDITDQRSAERALRQSEERFAKAFRASPDAVTISRFDDGRFIEVNDGFTRITGYTAAETVGRRSSEMGLWQDVDNRQSMIDALRREGHARDLEHSFRTKSGDLRRCQLSAETFEIGDQRFIVGVTRDVTEQTRAARALERSRQQLRDLTARLHAVREEERKAIAREIHDELGQALTALKLDIAWLRDKLPPGENGLGQRAESMLDLAGEILESVRSISARLRPAVLDDLGLEAAIEWQTTTFARRAGIESSLEICDPLPAVDGERDTAVFRILQESLTNVARHADAGRVDVVFRCDTEALELRVADDGRGIDLEAIDDSRSLGLIGMRERASALGGTLKVGRGSRGGTEVLLRMPIERPEAPSAP